MTTASGDPTASREWDYTSAYRALRERVVALACDTSPEAFDAIAPATPAWRVRDLLAHLAGVCDDIVHQNLDGVASDPWTAAQVAKRRDWPIERLLDEWNTHATAVEGQLNEFPPIIAGQMLSDAATHEHDVRGALGRPGARDSDALAIAFDWGTTRLSERFARDGLGTLHLETGVESLDLGDGEPTTSLHATRFDVVRSMAGRRSRAQLRSLAWQGPLEPEQLLLAPIFTPPAVDLVE